MTPFLVTARDLAGKPFKGLRTGESEGALALELAQEGLFLIRAEPVRPGLRWQRKAKLAPRDLTTFLLHLAAYLEAGIPLLPALKDFRDPERPAVEAAVASMAARVAEGAPFSAVMAAHPELFSPAHAAMVRAGEATGRLDQALRSVIKLVEWNAGLSASSRKAATYPLVLLAVLGIIGVVAGIYSLPPVLEALEDLGVPLPLVTRAFLALGHGVVRFGWILPLLGAGLWAGFRYAMARPALRLRWDTALLALPVAGKLIQKLALARFAHFFAAQHRSGIPMVEALRACEGVPGNARIGLAIAALRVGVEHGEGLAAAAGRTGQFPPIVLRMLAIGEAAGNLEEAMDKVAAQFQAEADESVRLVFAALDPAIKLVMAALVVFVACALLLPLYLLAGNLNG